MLLEGKPHILKDLEVGALMEVLASTGVQMVFILPPREKMPGEEHPFPLPQDLEL